MGSMNFNRGKKMAKQTMAKTNGYKKILLLASVSGAAIFFMAGVHLAGAQTGPAAVSQAAPAPTATLDEIVVTARKRNEKLLNVPISITAFTSKSLKKQGIYSIQDLANHTPGLTVDSTVSNSGRSDRSFPQYVIRGMVPSLTTNPTTTLFLDGAPLISGQVDNLENLERVEVLKGPQSAYFGRETFAGAISLITKDPSPTPQITIDSLIGSGNWYDQDIGIEGPIVPGKISVSGSFRYYSRQGSYENHALGGKTNQRLGDQGTKSGNLTVLITPNEDLRIKLLGLYWHDDDGPSAQELIVPSQRDCLPQDGVDTWFCGTVPDRLSNQPAANDLVTPQVQALLNTLASKSGLQVFKPLNNSYGLVRNAYHGSATIDYHINAIGATVTSLTAIDLQRFSELQDLANDDGSGISNPYYGLGSPATGNYANSYYDYPFYIENQYRNLSQEIRLTSDSDQRFRWLVGINYEYSRVDGSLGGGAGFDFFSPNSPDTSSTAGIFYGLAYDILPRLTLNFDGRLQQDDESTEPSYAGFSLPTQPKYAAVYRNFLPRVSLQYKIQPEWMAYATYSEGVNPGTFNGTIATDPLSVQAQIKAEGGQVKVDPEELTNFEVGSKGSFFGDKLQVSADVYYDIWYRQIISVPFNYLVGTTVENTAAFINDGTTHLAGLEADTEWEPTPGLVLNAAGAINGTDIVSGACYTCAQRTGTTNVKGKQLPDVSKYQLSMGAEYDGDFAFLENTSLSPLHDWGYFARGDYTYKSPNFEAEDNLVSTPAENILNLHAGITHGALTIEAFVDNLTNWGGPTSLAEIINLGNPNEPFTANNDSLVGGLPYLRSFGLRLRYTFGL